MKKAIIEIQKYPKNSFIIILPIVIVLFLFVSATDIWFQLFLGFILLVLFSSLFYLIVAKFEIELNNLGVCYQIKPFGKKQSIPKSDIVSVRIITFDFITVFGGWGVRKRRDKRAYIFNDKEFLLVKTSKTDYYFSIKDKTLFHNMIHKYYQV